MKICHPCLITDHIDVYDLSSSLTKNLPILITQSKCFVIVDPGNLDWWQTTVVYQVYPRSFKDSDGNGVGDLRGNSLRV